MSNLSFTRVLGSAQATHVLGRAVGLACRGGEHIALRGELGAGKTAFARGLAEGLGIDPAAMASPTFTICHEHDAGRGGIRFIHVDAYRLADAEELEALGWQELLADEKAVIALEWPERVPEALGAPHLLVELEHTTCGESEAEARAVVCSFSKDAQYLCDATSSKCPTSGCALEVGGDEDPFCSKQCRMADLDNWFSGRYVVSREIEEDDLVDPDVS